MNKNSISITTETENLLLKLSKELAINKKEEQRKEIESVSPYSKQINNAIGKYSEFFLYYSLRLQEATVTRSALIKEIDFDMWVSCKGKTNRQLIEDGQSPYAYDAEDGKIEIHHIGQDYDAPFAELTVNEHKFYGNSSVLHEFKKESWRQDTKKFSAFNLERQEYWRKRLSGEYVLLPIPEFKDITMPDFITNDELSFNIKGVLEMLFAECTVDDLKYISCLAENYALMKQIGAHSISDYINKRHVSGTEKITCSFCGDSDYIAHGSYNTSSENIKRYKCKCCGRTFTRVNNSIISGSNLSLIDWVKFIDCLYNAFSLEKTAKLCGMSVQAAQENRYKLFYALKILDDQVKLKGSVVIDETYVNVSYKGNHITDGIKLDRNARKRGGENHISGTSKNKVCVACAMDDEGNSVARVAGLAGGSIAKLDFALGDSIDKNFVDVLYGDKASSNIGYAKKKEIPILAEVQFRKGKKVPKNVSYNSNSILVNRHLQRINSYHSRLKKFVDQFNGLSTSYLAGYIYLFAWKERNKNRDIEEAYSELLNVMTERNLYRSIEEIVSGRIFPNPIFLEQTINKRWFKNKKKADDIYALYAKGWRRVDIAKKFNISRQEVHRYIKKYYDLGLAYKTDKEKELELQRSLPVPVKMQSKRFYANMAIYEEKNNWNGDINDFYKATMKKYGLSLQRIKNIVSETQRVFALREAIYIHENISFCDLQHIYQNVYEEYKTLRNENNTHKKSLNLLAKKHNYASSNIQRIITIMNTHGKEYFINKKRKLSINETINRDKAIFVDLLRWKGSVDNFYVWASEKYKLSVRYVKQIVFFCYLADPKRKEWV